MGHLNPGHTLQSRTAETYERMSVDRLPIEFVILDHAEARHHFPCVRRRRGESWRALLALAAAIEELARSPWLSNTLSLRASAAPLYIGLALRNLEQTRLIAADHVQVTDKAR